MVDAHCHIDLYPNPLSVIRACEQQGIYTLGVTNLPSHFKLGVEHVRPCKRVRLALGMHPLYAAKHRAEWALFTKCLPMTSYVGEVGLDFSAECIATQSQQIESFRFVLKQVGERKILSLHSRGAEMQVLSMLSEHRVPHAIFHWFTGTVEQARQIAAAGYYFSVNPAMIRSKKGRAIISVIPRGQLLTESDGPFIKIQHRSIEPADVREVYDYIAMLYRISLREVLTEVESNFRGLIHKALQQ